MGIKIQLIHLFQEVSININYAKKLLKCTMNGIKNEKVIHLIIYTQISLRFIFVVEYDYHQRRKNFVSNQFHFSIKLNYLCIFHWLNYISSIHIE